MLPPKHQGRPTNVEIASYFLEDGDFHRKVLMSLVRINHRLKTLEKKTAKLAEAMVHQDDDQANFSPAIDTVELTNLEKELASDEGSECKNKLKQAFRALALSVDDAREHVYLILDYLITVNTQVYVIYVLWESCSWNELYQPHLFCQ